MPSLTKISLTLSILLGIPIYLIYIVKEGVEFQIAGGIILLSLTSLLLFSGPSPIKPIINQKEFFDNNGKKSINNVELPPPVLENEGANYRRNQKIKRSRRVNTSDEKFENEIFDDDKLRDEILSQVIEEKSEPSDVKIAMPYVASIDPQSEMESEIDMFISQKRLKREELKKKITIERRMELAKRKASKVSNWAEAEDGENISKLLKDPNHGLKILLESDEVDSTIPHGISYIRIDQQRILKVRIPLQIYNKNTDDTIMPLPDPSGLPPLPEPPGLPPLPEPPGLPPLPEPPGLPQIPTPPPVKYRGD
jgi:hypothetical protein